MAEFSSRSNVVTLDKTATKILHNSFMSVHDVTYEESYKKVTEVGLLLKEEIKKINQRADVFPMQEDVSICKKMYQKTSSIS